MAKMKKLGEIELKGYSDTVGGFLWFWQSGYSGLLKKLMAVIDKPTAEGQTKTLEIFVREKEKK